MTNWNPMSPDAWADRFGMVKVPAFSSERSAKYPGQHSILLDGEAASFFFSCGSSQELMNPAAVPCWSWSSNVNHAVVVDSSEFELHIVRWDNPNKFITHPIPDADDAFSILETIESDKPSEEKTAVARALDAFRSLRHEIVNFGGNDFDAILAFGALLELVNPDNQIMMSEADLLCETVISELHLVGNLTYSPSQLSEKGKKFPIGEFVELLTSESPHGYTLDTELLIRHASGRLFQETHIQLSRPPVSQPKLFLTAPKGLKKPSGELKHDAHFTPPSLARLLVQEALSEHRRINGKVDKLHLLDPACGSGVFLIEALRELEDVNTSLRLQGIDNSPAARLLADYSVNRALLGSDFHGATCKINEEDSLSLPSWDSPDVILMNPPFLPWRLIDGSLQEVIRSVLADLYEGQPDTAIAFIAKAIQELKPGSVLGTVIPASFLESKAGRRLRRKINGEDTLCVSTIGRFRGYGYFRDAVVEPGFLVISRLLTPKQSLHNVKVALAEPGNEDKAIRGIRLLEKSDIQSGDAWEAALQPQSFLNKDDWTPRAKKASDLIVHFENVNFPKVTQLFSVHLGIRPGQKKDFLLSEDEYLNMLESDSERSLFLPTADEIRDGRVIPSTFIFYPYDKSGQLRCQTEEELKNQCSAFYEARLLPHREELKERKSLRNRKWWELSEPRVSWMLKPGSRILSTAYARRGMFSLDLHGRYAVVQGNAWVWKRSESLEDLWWAYLALANSAEFESLVDYFCRRTQGGQYEVSSKYIGRVPIPDLASTSTTITDNLGALGHELYDSGTCPLSDLSSVVCDAFGLPEKQMRIAFPSLDNTHLEEQFQELSESWKAKTKFISNITKKSHHPDYQRIIAIGKPVVPWILKDLQKNGPNDWFWALTEITGDNPITKRIAGKIQEMSNAWLKWGKMKDYLHD